MGSHVLAVCLLVMLAISLYLAVISGRVHVSHLLSGKSVTVKCVSNRAADLQPTLPHPHNEAAFSEAFLNTACMHLTCFVSAPETGEGQLNPLNPDVLKMDI